MAENNRKNRYTLIKLFRYLFGIPLFIFGVIAVRNAGEIPGFLSFTVLTVFEVTMIYLESERFLDLRLLVSLSWIFGIAMSCLNLSKLQSPWSTTMYVICGGFYFMFLLGYDLFAFFKPDHEPESNAEGGRDFSEGTETSALQTVTLLHERIKECIFIVFGLGFLGFMAEFIKFKGDVPLFADYSHAYTAFHISGVHYFVVSLIFVPVLSVIYLMMKKTETKERILIFFVNAVSILIHVLLLSKLQLLLSVIMPLLMWLLLQKRISKRRIILYTIAIGLGLSVVFFFLIMNRKYPEGYLEGIFRFRDPETPVIIQYPYIYVVNNFENLNLLTVNLQHFSYGKRSFYPLAALSGLKLIQAVKDFFHTEHYITCEELTTLTILYDVYGDFGTIGVYCFGTLLGVLNAFVTRHAVLKKTLLGLLLYAQLAVYMSLTFFATWFSDPTIWFWFAMTLFIAFWCTKEKGKFRFRVRNLLGEL